MPLTDTAVRTAKPDPTGKVRKLTDGGGLYLEVRANGAKYWRHNYRYLSAQKTIAYGVYPAVSLKEAREAHAASKKLLSQKIDPLAHRKEMSRQNYAAVGNSFEKVTEEWLKKKKLNWAPSTAVRNERSFAVDVFPFIGQLPIADINASQVLSVLRRVEDRGAAETAHRIKQRISEVFRYAIASQIASTDPTFGLKGALLPAKKENFAAILEPAKAGALLRAIDTYHGTSVVKAALKLAPLVFVRPGNLRQAEWQEIDLDAATWTIPAEKMKTKLSHIVPLSKQALEVLTQLKLETGNNPHNKHYVFPSIKSSKRPMSDNTILAALRTMGFPKEEMTGHGFRHMASTLLHEQGWDSDVIERQLAHIESNAVKGTYNKAQHIQKRTVMMQAWADYLDELRAAI